MRTTNKLNKAKLGYAQPQGNTISYFEWAAQLIANGFKIQKTKKGILVYK